MVNLFNGCRYLRSYLHPFFLNLIKFIVSIMLIGTFSSTNLFGQDSLPNLDDVLFDGKNFFAIIKGEEKVAKIDTNGSIIKEIGGKGRGPGEFSSPNIEITLIDQTLYILDKRGAKILEVDTKDFTIINETIIRDYPTDIFHYNDTLLSFKITPKFSEDEGKKIVGKYFTSEKVFNADDTQKNYLFRFEEKEELNPLYDQKKTKSIDDISIIYYPYKNYFYLYKDDILELISIPNMETKSLGNEIDRSFNGNSNIESLFKYKFSPTYKSILSVVKGSEDNTIILQVNSYLRGQLLLEYNYSEKEFRELGFFGLGKVIELYNNKIYFYHKNRISNINLNSIKKCNNVRTEVYVKNIDELDELLVENLLKIYNQSLDNHIPVNFIFKNSRWFFEPKLEDYKEVANAILQLGIWGKIKIVDDCEDCFKSMINVEILKNSDRIRIPLSTDRIDNSIFNCD
ncbi:MAG: hypothetical protein CL666_15340 [Balneola sp.]|nr:hypothetical protein [Balneola sp.]